MAKQFKIELGKITCVEMNEPGGQDEIYLLGGVEVRNKAGDPRPGLTKYFASQNVMIFHPGHIGVERSLSPSGVAYDEILDDDDVASLTLFLIEHDAASTMKNIDAQLIKFIRSLSSDIEGVPGPFAPFLPLAELFARFMDMVSNIIDDDDLMMQHYRKWRGNKALVDNVSDETTMDVGLYKPVTYTATITPM